MSIEQDARALMGLLSEEDLGPDDAEAVLRGVSDAVKEAVVHAVAAAGGPAPNGFLLSRLKLLRTPGSEGELAQLYRAHAASPDPGARTASLYGLEEVAAGEAVARAHTAAHDPDPEVVSAAADILLRLGGEGDEVRTLLAGISEAHRDDPAHWGTLAMLRGHGIGQGPLPDDVA